MRHFKYATLISFFLLFLAIPVYAFPENNLSSSLSGRILLDVDNNGEAWYVYPGDLHRYYLGTPMDAYHLMRNLSLGVSNDDFSKIEINVADRFKGLILLKPEDIGKAYYVSPIDKSLTYLFNGSDAFYLMRKVSLGITNNDLKTIPIGKIILNSAGQETSRQWQYFGWWGRINKDNVPVMSESKSDSKILGSFTSANKVKVLNKIKGDGRVWYQIDGGQYPGAYIDSQFVSAIAQPTPVKNLVVPATVKAGDYWIDVNIGKKILTLYKYDQPELITYIAVGGVRTPTIIGAYNVWYKTKKIRMRGAPPVATHVYDFPDVPWVMFYKGSYSVHGTYWHDNFGTQISSGCSGATQGDAKYIYDHTNPIMGELESIRTTTSNPGVVVNNHY